jgi:hypothetical protein
MRLFELAQLLEEPGSVEMNRHVVVSTASSLQTYFRGVVISLCDFNSDYRARAADLLRDKISIKDALAWTSGAAVTFGELIAHSITCNSVTDYVACMGALLKTNLYEHLKIVISPHDMRNGKAESPLLVPDVDVVFSRLNDLFKLRHILAHEAAYGLVVQTSTAREMLQATEKLIHGTDAIVWSTAFKDLPLTQAEMNIDAGKSAETASEEMDAALAHALNYMNDSDAAWQKEHQAKWTQLNRQWYERTYGTLQGSMWPSVAGVSYADSIRARTLQIRQWTQAIEPVEKSRDYTGFGNSFDY